MNPASNEKIDQIFEAIYKEAEKRQNEFMESPVPKIHIGMATCGIASGALETKKAFEEALDEYNIEARIHTVGCLGHCPYPYGGMFGTLLCRTGGYHRPS